MSNEVDAIIEALPDPAQRGDCRTLIALIHDVTGEPARVAYERQIAFGEYHFRYASGREGDSAKIVFAPTTKGLTIYLMSGLVGYDDLLERLGPHRTTKYAVFVRRLDDVDHDILRQLIERSVRHVDQVIQSLGALPRLSEMPPYVEA